jgi:beta-galactosidase
MPQWGTFITTPKVDKAAATLNIQTTVHSASNQKLHLKITVLDAVGKVAVTKTITVNDTLVNQNIAISKPQLWSVTRPYLYKVKLELLENNQVIDDQAINTGIRSFNFDADKGFSLNGQRMKINGVCMHHDLGALGAAVNTRAMERQLEILKAMGCNAIRTSHNPPAPELLDLCDRMGFLVMDEAFDMWKKRKTSLITHGIGINGMYRICRTRYCATVTTHRFCVEYR